MGNIAISVEHLSKSYRLGHADHRPENFRAAVRSFAAAPFEYLRSRLRPPSKDELFWALKDVSFEVKHGEVLGIIGRNGAGKSTLLKILSRITEPTEGRARVYGRVGSLLEVGTGFHPELSGRENIYLNGTILGMKRAEIDKKFDEIVDFSGIEKFLDTPVKRYSSGMYVRLAFAVAAHLEPEILVVDEVLAVGDAEFQKKCLGKMSDVARQGRTVLFVSHNMAVLASLCQQCLYLAYGSMENYGHATPIIQTYLAEQENTHKAIPLAQRTDRQGEGQAHVTGIVFRDCATRQEIETIISGQDIYIEVSYAQHVSTAPLTKFHIGLSFFNAMGQFVMVLNSNMANGRFERVPPEGRLYCHVPKFPLMSGEFSIQAILYVGYCLADDIEHAKKISVETGDFFGTGIPNANGRQGVYVPHEWADAIDSFYQ